MWRTVKLGDVLNTGAGGTPLKSKKNYYEGGSINWLLSGAVCEKDIYDCKTHITHEGLANSCAKLFPKNTVLVAMYGATAGQVGILRTEAATNQAVCGIYPSKDYLPEFLYYYLSNYKDTLLLEVSGVAQPNLSQVKIKNIPLPCIPLSEQQRIVAKLDAAFAEIDENSRFIEQQKENLNKLKRRILERFFDCGFPIKKLGEIEGVKSGGTPKSSENTYWQGDIEWFSSGELNSMYVSSTQKKITQAGLENSNAKLFPSGSLLIGMYDTAAMKMSILQNEATFNQAIVGIPPNNQFSSEYLFYALNYLKPEIMLERRGVRQQNLSLAKIKDIAVPMPSETQQQALVSELDKVYENISNLLLICENKAKLLNALKSAILAKELEGEAA